jgi:thiol:disulfide interchange protein DsbD
MSVYDGRPVIRFQITVSDDAAPGEYVLPVRFTYQPCNDKECRAPTTANADLTVDVGSAGEPAHTDVFAATPTQEEQTTAQQQAPPGSQSRLQGIIAKYGFWGYFIALGLAFVTGLLLSFSPCTYPMIPITVSIFAGQQRTVGRGFVLSLFYVGSMAVMYGIMGLVVSLVGGVFGAWLASPGVVIGIAVVFVIFSLSMFGLYELQVPSGLRQKLGTTRTSGGIGGSIVLGIVAALVVSPCVGPFVAGILLYVATHGSPLFGFIVLFTFAIGLGTLFVIIGTFSSAINALPGAGEWMESVKKFFGFVLLLMALYFLRTIVPANVIAVLTGLVLLALGIFGGGFDRLTPDARFFQRLKKFIGILAFLIGAYLLVGTMITRGFILPPAGHWLPGVDVSVTDSQEHLIPWETDLESGLERAKLENRPVLIDTWATWCANCRVLDERTFNNPAVAQEAQRFVPIKVQLESLGSETTKQFMTRFGMKTYSLPTTLLLDSQGNIKQILQGVVGPDDMIVEMQKIR